MKDSVFNQCTASTFEEAHRVNNLRYFNERRLAADLAAETAAEGKPVEGVEPEFWDGCHAANEIAYKIYQEESEALRKRIADRLEALVTPPGQIKAFEGGFADAKGLWIEAMKKNDPGIVVYW